MFFLDDMLLRILGVNLPGLDMIWTLEQIYRFAYRELYNPDKIKNQIKEARLLYEFGELTSEEYCQRNHDLMQKLKLAQKAEEMNMNARTNILG